MSDTGITCSFCLTPVDDVPMMIKSSNTHGVFVCSNCVGECVQQIARYLADKVKVLPLDGAAS